MLGDARGRVGGSCRRRGFWVLFWTFWMVLEGLFILAVLVCTEMSSSCATALVRQGARGA